MGIEPGLVAGKAKTLPTLYTLVPETNYFWEKTQQGYSGAILGTVLRGD